MLLADRLEILNDEGDLNTAEGGTYTRTSQYSYYTNLVTKGVSNIYDAIELVLNNETKCIELVKTEDESKMLNSTYIGSTLGVVEGSQVDLKVIFLDGSMFVDIEQGFLNIGTPEQDFIYESHLTEKDEEILNSSKMVLTTWLTDSQLKDSLNSLIKDENEVFETMYGITLTAKGAVFSTKINSKTDLSNGFVAKRRKEEQERKEAHKRKVEQRRMEALMAKQERINLKEKEEAKAIAEQGSAVQNMFKMLLGNK